MSKLWGGRFSKETDKLTEEFNASIDFDYRLASQDITASIVHVTMLGRQGILSEDEVENILNGLNSIKTDLENNKITFDRDLEDIHTNIESLLTKRIGEDGKRLHTARSRNDQVITDFRLYTHECCQKLISALRELMNVLNNLAEKHLESYLPGYTHLQIAQPVTYAHYLLCYFEMFYRDYKRFLFIDEECLNASPLGAGALAGTTYPIDLEFTAEKLGFRGTNVNSMDAVSDRDFAISFLSGCATIMMHLSRICEELIIFSSSEFNFISLDEAFTTGSSIMPQKKNPDVAELIRGKTGRTYGNLISLLTTMKALPLAYDKDMQEDKEPVFDSFETVERSLKILTEMMKTLKFNKEKARKAMEFGFINATDLADYLVKSGVGFRDAHELVGKIVIYCEKENRKLSELTLEELRKFSPLFSSDVFDAIDIEKIVKARNTMGGPSPDSNAVQIKENRKFLEQDKYRNGR